MNRPHVLHHLVLLVLAAVFLAPFAWMVSTSLKVEERIFTAPGQPVEWIPRAPVRDDQGRRVVNYGGQTAVEIGHDEDGASILQIGTEQVHAEPGSFDVQTEVHLHWQNYARAFETMDFWNNLRNTLFVCVTTVIGTLVSCSLVAYSFARIPWRGRNTLFILCLATMMLPYQVTLIPLFVLYKNLGWNGTYLPLIVPYFFGTPFYVFLLRQFFMNIPQDLSSAARIDGCSEFGIFLHIILPLSKPALATTALFMFLFQWGDFLNPLIYLQDERQYTLAIALQQFQSQHESAWGPMMAMATTITLPIVLLFFLTQRTFIQGITMSGLKG